MQVTKILAPGNAGTHQFVTEYGEKLVCVRYRNDPENKRRLTTVELIVRETHAPELQAHPLEMHPSAKVYVKIHYQEETLRTQAKSHGAIWDPAARL